MRTVPAADYNRREIGGSVRAAFVLVSGALLQGRTTSVDDTGDFNRRSLPSYDTTQLATSATGCSSSQYERGVFYLPERLPFPYHIERHEKGTSDDG
jgi:hypothetical protein